MLTSVPYPGGPVQLPDDEFTERLRGLTRQQLLDAMTFLAFCEATGWGEDGFDPALVPAPDNAHDPDSDPAPVCGRCGGELGIFLKLGLDWRHYRGAGLDDIELYEPGHPAELTWRYAVPAATPRAA